MAYDSFSVGDITAVIGDNSAHEKHKAGYNGIWSLTHKKEPANLFVPEVTGFNLEHIFDGATLDIGDDGTIFFEPRKAPMEFKKLSGHEAELHQPPTPTFHLESWTKFTLVAPHYIDISFRCQATQHVFVNGYIGLFWASYINAPDDKSMYLRGKQGWLQQCSPAHNNDSTVLHEDDRYELKFAAGHRDCLYKNVSPLKYDLPLFYGLYQGQTYITMFDRVSGIRLAHSPSGGGFNQEKQTSLPAWDFQYIIPRYEILTEYSFRCRLVYRPRCSREEVLKEYEGWKKELG